MEQAEGSLSPDEIRRSDASRLGPGAKRKGGRPTNEEVKIRAELAAKAEKEKLISFAPNKIEGVSEPVDVTSTQREIAQEVISECLEEINVPLVELEKGWKWAGCKDKEIQLTEKEIRRGSVCIAGTLEVVSPNAMKYLGIVSLVTWTIATVGTRLVTIGRISTRVNKMRKDGKMPEGIE